MTLEELTQELLNCTTFSTPKGTLSISDVFSLPLKTRKENNGIFDIKDSEYSLNMLANATYQDIQPKDFTTSQVANTDLLQKHELVKFAIQMKVTANEIAERKAKEICDTKNRIELITKTLEAKEVSKLSKMDTEELEKELARLGGE